MLLFLKQLILKVKQSIPHGKREDLFCTCNRIFHSSKYVILVRYCICFWIILMFMHILLINIKVVNPHNLPY